jgi:hypothetical protein
MSSEQMNECPICYESIEQIKNCVTTECGHQFHCKCLMQNAATNGFSCPMCRTTMATELESDDEDEYSEYSDYYEDSEGIFDDNTLTSFRMFHQQLAGEEVEEEEEDPNEDVEEDEDEEEEGPKPTSEFITSKLIAQGITMEDLVKCMLIDHEEYEENAETYNRCADRMFGKFRIIISNYSRQQSEQSEARHQSVRLRRHDDEEDLFSNVQTRRGSVSDIYDSEDY